METGQKEPQGVHIWEENPGFSILDSLLSLVPVENQGNFCYVKLTLKQHLMRFFYFQLFQNICVIETRKYVHVGKHFSEICEITWGFIILVCFEFLISFVIEKEHSLEQFLIISVRWTFKGFSELRQVTLTLLSI